MRASRLARRRDVVVLTLQPWRIRCWCAEHRLHITLPTEQQPNPYITPELSFQFHYFAMRKMHLAMRASALAIFPGGFGTMDEMFELLTLQQTRKAHAYPHSSAAMVCDLTAETEVADGTRQG